jgi:hypothetical protein
MHPCTRLRSYGNDRLDGTRLRPISLITCELVANKQTSSWRQHQACHICVRVRVWRLQRLQLKYC